MKLHEVVDKDLATGVRSDDIPILYQQLQRADHHWMKDYVEQMEPGDNYPESLSTVTDQGTFDNIVLNLLYNEHWKDQRQWDKLVVDLWKYHLTKIGKGHLY